MPVFLARSKAHPESGLWFDPPHDRCFRLDQQDHVKELKGMGLHEMDFGWWDEAARAMHLLEVKDYSLPQTNLDGTRLVDECVQKATDCVLLLASIWHDLPHAPRLRDCVPEEWHARPEGPVKMNLFFVFKTPVANKPIEWNALQAKARNRLHARRELFHLREASEVFLMDHGAAANRGLPIKTEEDLAGPRDAGRRGKKDRGR